MEMNGSAMMRICMVVKQSFSLGEPSLSQHLERISKVGYRFQKVPTDERARECEERFVDARPTFIAHVQPAELMEPRQRAFDDPARSPEPTAVSSPAFGQLRLDPEAVESVAVGLRI